MADDVPTTMATRIPDSGITSNQSPPTPERAAGRYREAASTAAVGGSVRGSRLRWRVRVVSRSRE